MPGTIRRGKAAISEASKNTGGGGEFTPFLKSIYWKDDGEERYLLFLTPMEESPQFEMIEFIKTERGYPEMTVSKTDEYFGERSDRFVSEWDATPRVRNIAIAVELEPSVEVVKGRRKATGFEVKTEEFSRKVLDDEGNPTEETEDVTAPAVGVVVQSPKNFFNILNSHDDTDWPVHETPVRVKRIGTRSDTSYSIDGFDTIEPDLTNLTEFLDGITYLGEDLDDLLEKIDGMDPLEAAHAIGEVLLDKRCEELLDEDRYEELFEGQDESMDTFGSKKKDKKAAGKKASRPSQRRKAAAKEDPEETGADEPAAEPEAEVTKESSREERLAAIRQRSATKKAKKKE